jgi:AbrB family looped-hinge helix DNA binding protein
VRTPVTPLVREAETPYIYFSNGGAAVNALTITAKGQVTLPKDLLKHLGVQPGQMVAVAVLPGGRIEVRAAQATGKISDAFNLLKRPNGPSLSSEQINEIAAKG